MSSNFPDIKAFSAAPFESFTAATASSTKGLQAIAAETTDYAKKSFEKSRAHFEKLISVKKIDEAIQLQSDFAKSAYEDFVAQATKIGEIYSNLAKEAFKPTTVASSAKPTVVAEPTRTPVNAKQNLSSAA
jgi:phasin family protein